MSKSRARRHGWQRPEKPSDAHAPAEGTKGYQRVLDAGCLGTRDYWGEFDCPRYWSCDSCPIVYEAHKNDPEPQLIQLLP